MKRKTKRILVVGVKWRHRTNGLFLNFECTFCGFLSRRCKNVENAYETFVNTIEYTECTSSFFRNLASLVGLKQAKRSDPPWRKQDWIPRNDNFIAKSSRLPTKRKLSILLNFLFSFVSFIRVFSILKYKTLDHPMMNVRQPFCWWMSVTKVSNPLLPPPLMWLTIWLL